MAFESVVPTSLVGVLARTSPRGNNYSPFSTKRNSATTQPVNRAEKQTGFTSLQKQSAKVVPTIAILPPAQSSALQPTPSEGRGPLLESLNGIKQTFIDARTPSKANRIIKQIINALNGNTINVDHAVTYLSYSQGIGLNFARKSTLERLDKYGDSKLLDQLHATIKAKLSPDQISSISTRNILSGPSIYFQYTADKAFNMAKTSKTADKLIDDYTKLLKEHGSDGAEIILKQLNSKHKPHSLSSLKSVFDRLKKYAYSPKFETFITTLIPLVFASKNIPARDKIALLEQPLNNKKTAVETYLSEYQGNIEPLAHGLLDSKYGLRKFMNMSVTYYSEEETIAQIMLNSQSDKLIELFSKLNLSQKLSLFTVANKDGISISHQLKNKSLQAKQTLKLLKNVKINSKSGEIRKGLRVQKERKEAFKGAIIRTVAQHITLNRESRQRKIIVPTPMTAKEVTESLAHLNSHADFYELSTPIKRFETRQQRVVDNLENLRTQFESRIGRKLTLKQTQHVYANWLEYRQNVVTNILSRPSSDKERAANIANNKKHSMQDLVVRLKTCAHPVKNPPKDKRDHVTYGPLNPTYAHMLAKHSGKVLLRMLTAIIDKSKVHRQGVKKANYILKQSAGNTTVADMLSKYYKVDYVKFLKSFDKRTQQTFTGKTWAY